MANENEESIGGLTHRALLNRLYNYFENDVGQTGNLWEDEATGGGSVSEETLTFNGYDTWYPLDNDLIDRDGTLTVTEDSDTDPTTYVEDTDYRVDYESGWIMPIDGGAIGSTETVRVTYDYEGSSTPIEIGNLAHISIMVQLYAESDITAYVSSDGNFWYRSTVITTELPGGSEGELSAHVYQSLGANYIKLGSGSDVNATATIDASP